MLTICNLFSIYRSSRKGNPVRLAIAKWGKNKIMISPSTGYPAPRDVWDIFQQGSNDSLRFSYINPIPEEEGDLIYETINFRLEKLNVYNFL